MVDQLKKRTKKPPRGITIVELPNFGKQPLMLCAGTGLPSPNLVFTDPAFNSCGFLTPFVAYVYLRNVQDMDATGHVGLTDASKRLVQMGINRLMEDRCFNMELLDEAAGETKGNQTSKSRFRKAIEVAARSSPFVYAPSSAKPFLPLSNSLAAGSYEWVHLTAKLGDLLRIGQDFEVQWGWHCTPLKRTSDQVRENRKDKRQPKTWAIKRITTDGDTSLYPAIPTHIEALDRFSRLFAELKGPLAVDKTASGNRARYMQDSNGTEILLFRSNHEEDIDRLLNHGKAPSNTNKRQRTPELSSSLSSSPSSSEGILEMPQTPDFVLDWPPNSSCSTSQ